MAEILPFRGVRYDEQRAGQLDRVIAPPYDVISDVERAALAQQSPYNIVHLILPTGEGDEKYASAGRELRRWVESGIVQRDGERALYRYHQIFSAAGRELVRKGFVCRVRLHRFDEGIVLPHERTLAGPKIDRLKLTRACRMHLSQILGLYSDPQRRIDGELSAVESQPPEAQGRTGDGVLHRIWRVTEPAVHERVEREMADKKIYIADGHHRYETMLALRDELRPLASSPRSSIEFASMFLTGMDDPGLVIFPTHRVVHGLGEFDLAQIAERLRRRFDVQEIHASGAEALRAALAASGRAAPSFVLASGDRTLLLKLRPGQDVHVPGPRPLRTVDVAILHALVLEEILGIDRAAQEKQTNLRYVKDFSAALAEAQRSGVQAVFLLNPTRIEQLEAVASTGEVMPQKSTFFYPKLASGLVMNPIDPAEEA
jgi:uncharacterized protein (DUF1015 family)